MSDTREELQELLAIAVKNQQYTEEGLWAISMMALNFHYYYIDSKRDENGELAPYTKDELLGFDAIHKIQEQLPNLDYMDHPLTYMMTGRKDGSITLFKSRLVTHINLNRFHELHTAYAKCYDVDDTMNYQCLCLGVENYYRAHSDSREELKPYYRDMLDSKCYVHLIHGIGHCLKHGYLVDQAFDTLMKQKNLLMDTWGDDCLFQATQLGINHGHLKEDDPRVIHIFENYPHASHDDLNPI